MKHLIEIKDNKLISIVSTEEDKTIITNSFEDLDQPNEYLNTVFSVIQKNENELKSNNNDEIKIKAQIIKIKAQIIKQIAKRTKTFTTEMFDTLYDLPVNKLKQLANQK